MTNWAETKPLQYRAHANSRIAEVRLQTDGRFSALERPAAHKGAIGREFSVNIATQPMARLIADLHAHPGCDGVKCGQWQDVPAPPGEPERQATLVGWVDEQVQRINDLQDAKNLERLIKRDLPLFVRPFTEALEIATKELNGQLGATAGAVTCITSAAQTTVKCICGHGCTAKVVIRHREGAPSIDLDFTVRKPGRRSNSNHKHITFFTDQTDAVRASYDDKTVEGPEALAVAVIRDALPPDFIEKLAKRE